MFEYYLRVEQLINRRQEGDLQDVVIGAQIKYVMRDTVTGHDWFVSKHVDFGPPDSQDFTPFRDLEPYQVESWILAQIGSDTIQQWQQQCQEIRARQEESQIEKPPSPWMPGWGHFSDENLHWLLTKDGAVVGQHMIWMPEQMHELFRSVGITYEFPLHYHDCYAVGLVPWKEPRDLGNGGLLWPCYLQGERPIEDHFQYAVCDYEFQGGIVIGTWRAQDCDLWIVQRSIGAEINTNRNVGDQIGFSVDLGDRTLRIPTGPTMSIWLQRQLNRAQPTVLTTDMVVQSVTPAELEIIMEKFDQRCEELDLWHIDRHQRLHAAQTVSEIRALDIRPPGMN